MSIESLQRRVDHLAGPDQDRKYTVTGIVLMSLTEHDDDPHDPSDPCVLFEVGTKDMLGRWCCWLGEDYLPSSLPLNASEETGQ